MCEAQLEKKALINCLNPTEPSQYSGCLLLVTDDESQSWWLARETFAGFDSFLSGNIAKPLLNACDGKIMDFKGEYSFTLSQLVSDIVKSVLSTLIAN